MIVLPFTISWFLSSVQGIKQTKRMQINSFIHVNHSSSQIYQVALNLTFNTLSLDAISPVIFVDFLCIDVAGMQQKGY